MDDFEYAMGGSPGTNPFSLSDYSIGVIIPYVILFIVIIINIISLIRFFSKMGYRPWKAIIPVYNCMILAEIGDMKKIMGLLYLVPIANIVFWYKTCKVIAKKMNLNNTYVILLTILPFALIPFIAFNKNITCADEYKHNDEVVEKEVDKVTNLDDLMIEAQGSEPAINEVPTQEVQNNVSQNNVEPSQPSVQNNTLDQPVMQNTVQNPNVAPNPVPNPNPAPNPNTLQNPAPNNGVFNPNMMPGATHQNQTPSTPNNGVFDPNNFGNNQ